MPMPKVIDDEAIYQAVRRAILERGYAAATTRQIAQLAHVSEVTLFRKFGSKAHLVTRAFLSMTEELDFAASAHYTGDLLADLTRVVAYYQTLALRHGPFMAVLLTEIPRYPELAELLARPVSMMQEIAQLITRYQSEGTLQRENPVHTVTALIGPLVYSVMVNDAMPGSVPDALDVGAYVTRFVHGRAAS